MMEIGPRVAARGPIGSTFIVALAGATSGLNSTDIRRRSSRGGASGKSEGREGEGQDGGVAAEHGYLFVRGDFVGGNFCHANYGGASYRKCTF